MIFNDFMIFDCIFFEVQLIQALLQLPMKKSNLLSTICRNKFENVSSKSDASTSVRGKHKSTFFLGKIHRHKNLIKTFESFNSQSRQKFALILFRRLRIICMRFSKKRPGVFEQFAKGTTNVIGNRA